MKVELNSARLPDLQALHVATVVMETGGMSAAAARLGVTQSAISQAVKRAEAQLGLPLLHRKTRPVLPTEAGRLLLRHMAEISQRLDHAIADMRLLAGTPERRELRLGMVDSFSSTVGPLLIQHLMTHRLAVRVTAQSGLSGAQVEALAQHRIDAAIISDMGQRPEGVGQQLIYKEPFVLVAPLRQEPRLRDLSLREVLKLQPLIRYGQTSHLGGQIEAHLSRIGVHAPVHLSFERSDALIAMIAAGVGVAITTPLCLVQTAANWQKLAVLPLPGPGFTRSLMLMSRDRGGSQMSQHIAKVAREILGREILPEMQARLPWLRPGPQWMVPEAEDL